MAETKDTIPNPWTGPARNALRLELIRDAICGLCTKSPTPTPEFIAETAIKVADAVLARLPRPA